MTTAAPSRRRARHYAMDLMGRSVPRTETASVTPYPEWGGQWAALLLRPLSPTKSPTAGARTKTFRGRFCYPANNDQMAMSPHLIPVPTPVAGLRLAAKQRDRPGPQRVYDIG